jgi:poly [ADP-ribose] polymerase
VPQIVKSAQDVKSLKIVSLDWLLESVEKKMKCPEAKFLLGADTDGTAPAPQAAPEADAEELPKKRKAGSTVVAADEEDKAKDEDQNPPAKKAKADAKGKGKAKQEPEKDETKNAEDDKKKEEPKIKTIVKKGKAPVDELCPVARKTSFSSFLGLLPYSPIFCSLGTAHVYVDSAGCIYDATLNQANIGFNNNKFYYCQVRVRDVGSLDGSL